MSYDIVADDKTIETTKAALEAGNFKVTVVENGEAARRAVLDLLPKGAEVMTMTSKTLEKLDLLTTLNESGNYDAVRSKLNALGGDEHARERRKLGAAPDFAIGSVHAVTEDGHVLIASYTGSQLPSYVYGAGHVIWVVGAQKIVKDTADAWKRLEEYVVPLEDERAKEVYGFPTRVDKVLLYNREVAPGRVDIILVKEILGF